MAGLGRVHARLDDAGTGDVAGLPRPALLRQRRARCGPAARQQEKKIEISGWVMAVNVLFSVGFFVFMYKFLPLVAATELKRVSPAFGNQIVFNLVDGAIRIALFLLFIWGISLWKDIRRVYEYHGAEHKTVFAFESGDPLTPAAVQKYSTYHPRCGTSFLMTVLLISIVFYTVIPVTTFWARFAIRIALLPVIAGVSYEIIRYAAKHRGSLFALMTAPGLWLQRITTQPPSDDQVECAIRALDEAMAARKAARRRAGHCLAGLPAKTQFQVSRFKALSLESRRKVSALSAVEGSAALARDDISG